MTTAPPVCPRCHVPVQPDWDWCQSCGYDPEGTRGPADAPVTRAPVPPPAAPAVPKLDDFGSAARRDPVPPPKRRPIGAALKVVVVLVVAVVGIGAVVAVVMRDSDKNKAAPAATPTFTSGLTVFFSTSSPGASPVVLPDDLPGCVQQKLTVGEASEISALHRPADSDRLSDATNIHVFRAVRDCDLAGAAEVLTAQKDIFSSLGVNDISQQECVMQHVINSLAALSDATTGSMDGHTRVALEAAFKTCVPLASALASSLHLDKGIPTDAAKCIADNLQGKVTWADLFADTPADKAKFEAAVRTAVPACQ